MIRAVFSLLMIVPAVAQADSVIATRTVRAQSILEPADMALVAASLPGALTDPAAGVGLEARVTLYAGRAIRGADIGPPAIIERNQIVTLRYRAGTLGIVAEGRALMRGADGDVIRVMNLTSRATISGRIAPDGGIEVGPTP